VTGGPAFPLAMIDGNRPGGATWAPDDTIIVSTNNVTTGLQRVAATGGPMTVLTRPDHAQGEGDHSRPRMLPDGRRVLFTIDASTGSPDAAQVAVLDLQTEERTVLLRSGRNAQYVSSRDAGREGGYLVYASGGALWAVPFDLTSLKLRGPAVPVIAGAGGGDAVVAGDGTLVYVSAAYVSSASVPGAGALRALRLVWVDRLGRETPVPAEPRAFAFPRLSPDGTRIAVYAADQDRDLWIWDLGRRTLARTTFDPGSDLYGEWTPDSRRLIFSSQQEGIRNLFSRAADGTGGVERLTESPNQQNVSAVSPDGRVVIFSETVPKTGEDVMQLTLDGTRRVTPLVQSSFSERNGILSPDGRWLAYQANDSGRFEIFVRRFPEVNSGHWQVTTTGGTRPLWTRGGQELVYVSLTGALMRIGVAPGPSWAATTPALLVKEGYDTSPGTTTGRTYDAAPDGQRFLMVKAGEDGETAAPASLIVVQHWVEELKRLVPTK
jgi:eukaryotic-like serine/threonine-protein kinase